MNQNVDISSFIAGAERNMRQSLLPPGYFAKQTYLQSTDVFTATYGRKVWDALNNQTRFWNIIRKVQWGPTTGWRIRTDRGPGVGSGSELITATTRPTLEAGSLPVIDSSNYVTVDSPPRIVSSMLGVTLRGQIMSGLEGGMGDNLAVEQEARARDHIKELNQELLLANSARLGAGNVGIGGTAGTASVTNFVGTFRDGDTISIYDASANADVSPNSVIAGRQADGSFRLVGADGTQAVVAGDIAYIKQRAGFTSLDDIVDHYGRNIAGTPFASGYGPGVYNMYQTGRGLTSATGNGLLTARAANSWAAPARVLSNNGVSRNLTTELLDEAIREVRVNGADPDVILMGYDQLDRLNQVLQSRQRFLETSEFTVKVGDDSTLPGSHGGFQLATYKSIPIFVDADCPRSVSSTGTMLGSNVYVLDTRYLEVAIAAPTQYMDNRDFFAANALVLRGLFYTIGELRSLRFDVHSKITDLAP